MQRILSLALLLLLAMALPAMAQEQRRMKGEGKAQMMTPPSQEEFLKQMDQTIEKMGKVRDKMKKGNVAPDARMMRMMMRLSQSCDMLLEETPAKKEPAKTESPSSAPLPTEKK